MRFLSLICKCMQGVTSNFIRTIYFCWELGTERLKKNSVFIFLQKCDCTDHSFIQWWLSVWPPLLTTVRQGHCKWLSLRRQFTCWLVLIQTDEGGQLCLSAYSRECLSEKDGDADCVVLSVASMFAHLNVARISKCVCIIVGKSTKVTTLLLCIIDELKSLNC